MNPTDGRADIQDWNRIADAYADRGTFGTEADTLYRQFREVLWESLGDLRGRDVLDVGCGHGWLCRLLADAGARVVGVDGSAALLAKARALYPDVEFIEHDLALGLPDTGRTYDRIVAYMVLMDIPEIGPLLQAVRRALRPGGRFIATMQHPVFFNQKTTVDPATGEAYSRVTGYLQPAVWRIASFGGHHHYHRSLTYYVESLRAAGMALTHLYEPPHIPGPDALAPEFYRHIPKFLLLEAVPLP